MKFYNASTHGLKDDRFLLQTEAVQKMVDESSSLGQVLYFPAGHYVIGTVHLRDHTHIRLAKGAYLLGAPSFYDYEMQEKIDYPLYQDASHSYFHCSMFVGISVSDITIDGKGTIDMRSVWDEDNVRNIVHRGPKCIALRECKNVILKDFHLKNATDLAIYFAGCENVTCDGLFLFTHIDGISPDGSKNVIIRNCRINAGDDAIVFKASYTLNRLEPCENIEVRDCELVSRCNCLKWGTESNGDFRHFLIENVSMKNTRITGISIESVDGSHIDDIVIRNVTMKNVLAPLFIHLGDRLRGPKGTKRGSIANITIENVTATGPYRPYHAIAHNYQAYKENDVIQYPWYLGNPNGKDMTARRKTSSWQFTSNICGKPGSPLTDINLRNVHLFPYGGVLECNENVPENGAVYPEVNAYGNVLPAQGIYFRHIDGLSMDNVTVSTWHKDIRKDFVFDDVTFQKK